MDPVFFAIDLSPESTLKESAEEGRARGVPSPQWKDISECLKRGRPPEHFIAIAARLRADVDTLEEKIETVLSENRTLHTMMEALSEELEREREQNRTVETVCSTSIVLGPGD